MALNFRTNIRSPDSCQQNNRRVESREEGNSERGTDLFLYENVPAVFQHQINQAAEGVVTIHALLRFSKAVDIPRLVTSQSMSRVRLLLLVGLLVAESALTMTLRTSGWVATGHFIRSLVIVTACALPFGMTAVLLYRCRVDLWNRQFSLRALMSLILVVASYLVLFSYVPKKPNTGPLPIAPAVQFEIYVEAASGTASGPTFTDTNTGEALQVTTPPIVTAADISSLELMPGQQHQQDSELLVNLHPAGGNKLLKATAAAKGKRCVVVVDGKVLATPRIYSPVGIQFLLSGGTKDGNEVFRALTASPTRSD